MNRLVAFVRSASSPAARKRSDVLTEALQRAGSWSEVLNRRGVRLLISKSPEDVEPLVLNGGAGVVLGLLFRRETSERALPASAEGASHWCDSDGQAFARDYWGNYLAFVCGHDDRVLIMRDPAGARPCFVSSPDDAGVRIVFTHVEDFASVAKLPAIDEKFLALFLAHPRLVTDRTGLSGVREVLAGECIVLQGDDLRAPIAWRPPVRARAHSRTSSADLARELRVVIERTAGAWISLGLPIVHRLSGGLDSSVALAALASNGYAEIRCITERPAGFPEGDEAEAARAVARRFGAPLVESLYRAEDFNYSRLLETPLVAKPSITELSFADQNFLAALGETPDITLLTSGQGGDQVFYRSNALCLGADAVRDGLAPSEIIQVALNAARASRRSIWPVLAKALEYGLARNAKDYVAAVMGRVVDAADKDVHRCVLEEVLTDDWVRSALRRGPGEAMRALQLADLQYYHGPGLLSDRFLVTPVLTSQPIIEFCCQIPAYRTVEGGRDRGLVRLAFADDLPASAVERRRKGDTTRFHAAVAQVNDSFVRDILCGGELERRGLFSSSALNSIAPTKVLDFSHYLVAELWLRKVKSVGAPVSESPPSFDA